jgi:hypothetical protein
VTDDAVFLQSIFVQAENACFRNRLDHELDEATTRSLVRANVSYIEDVWHGRVESSRYSAYQKGGWARHALLYHMITHPFSDSHLEWVLDEVKVKKKLQS